MPETRFIFITGGVVSSLGKGIAASALGALLQAQGFRIRIRKFDPYLNVDSGTLSPYQHGEVYVTDDGAEADLDLGHYERFTSVATMANDHVTTGKIYSRVLAKERQGSYLGSTVQVVPHIVDEIKRCVMVDTQNVDFVICEIGGTIGDIEGLPYIEAIRQFRGDLGREKTMFVHLTLVPYIAAAKELKTKPSQHSVRSLLSLGIQPDILICRTDRELGVEHKRKLAMFCNVLPSRVIEARDLDTIYRSPLALHAEHLDREVCEFFNIDYKVPDLKIWQDVTTKIAETKPKVHIALVGKYVGLQDAYKSLLEVLNHAGLTNNVEITIDWVDACDEQNKTELTKRLLSANGIIVPGGFGERGVIGKMLAITIARENNIPILGICFGMQLMVVEFARNVLGIKDASSTEFEVTNNPIVGLMTEWLGPRGLETRDIDSRLGGTMRLGAYPCSIKKDSLAHKIYGQDLISERHRHRYEVNIQYQEQLENSGLIFSGMSPDNFLPEIAEYQNHPWFLGVQFHPELKSSIHFPHPLFVDFIKTCHGADKL